MKFSFTGNLENIFIHRGYVLSKCDGKANIYREAVL